MKKYGIYFLIFTLLFTINPIPPMSISAEESDEENKEEEEVVLLSEEVGEDILLFESVEDIDNEEKAKKIPDESEAVLLLDAEAEEIDDIEYFLIRYIDEEESDEEQQVIKGYVESDVIVPFDLADDAKEEREEAKEDSESDSSEETTDQPESEEPKEDGSQDDSEEEESIEDESEKEKSEEEASDAPAENEEEATTSTIKTANQSIKEEKTSRLGRINNKNVEIYESINGKSAKAGSKLIDHVYYIKKQAKLDKDTYYLLSTRPSSSKGTIGWVKSDQIKTHSHRTIDNTSKSLRINGKGNSRAKAWGDKKDYVHTSMSKYTNQTFQVDKTESVGNNTWYRGKINGKGNTVWLHYRYVDLQATESKTSRLARINNKNINIYEEIGGSTFKAGTKYTDAVYYVKRKAVLDNETYYLLSKKPSASSGIVGWAKSKDVKSHTHKAIDNKKKEFVIKGVGNTRTKVWGAKKDYAHSNLNKYVDESFHVDKTETVANNTWYRGKINGKGQKVWLHSKYVTNVTIEKISELARVKNKNVKIYESINGTSKKIDSNNVDNVYYAKKQAKVGKQTYYLLSTQSNPSKGVVGWVRSQDVKTHLHQGVDKKSKTFYIKGNGNARAKAWGAKNDIVHSNMSKYKHNSFKVNLTETVANNTWYRGKINGKGNNVWLHSNYVTKVDKSKTSKLARVENSNVEIFSSLGGTSSKAGSKYTNLVYYVKQQAKIDNTTYYLLSTRPSSSKGTIGWVRSQDVSSHTHKGVDKKSKTLYIKGNGNARSKAWGADKDIVQSDLSKHSGLIFQVNLTEKVGNNTWYRGKINDKGENVWLHSNFVTNNYESKTIYSLTLTQAVNIQSSGNPIIYKGNKQGAATKSQIKQYMDPKKYMKDPVQRFQFLDLSKPSGSSVSLLNKYLKGKGTLSGQGKAFYNAARNHGINDVYLLAHSQLETGHGTSNLASGVKVGKNKKGKLELVTKKNEKKLTSIKTTYNMYGIGAVDSDPLKGGATTAYEEGWTSPAKAIDGGAKWISRQYIQNEHNQNTLYKMKWNPNMNNGYAWKQYATDVAWASKQVNTIYNMYQEIGFPDAMAFDYPVYR